MILTKESHLEKKGLDYFATGTPSKLLISISRPNTHVMNFPPPLPPEPDHTDDGMETGGGGAFLQHYSGSRVLLRF